jgi:hypothetical protein
VPAVEAITRVNVLDNGSDVHPFSEDDPGMGRVSSPSPGGASLRALVGCVAYYL